MATHAPTTSRRTDAPPPGVGTSRRRLLAAAGPAAMVLGGAGIAAAVQVAPGPDTALIALCAQLDKLERAYVATDLEADERTPAGRAAAAERNRLSEAQQPIVDAICATPPRTLVGTAAVAASLALWDAELLRNGGPGGYTNDRLLAALVRGLTGRHAA